MRELQVDMFSTVDGYGGPGRDRPGYWGYGLLLPPGELAERADLARGYLAGSRAAAPSWPRRARRPGRRGAPGLFDWMHGLLAEEHVTLMGASTHRLMSEIVANNDDLTFPRMAQLPCAEGDG